MLGEYECKKLFLYSSNKQSLIKKGVVMKNLFWNIWYVMKVIAYGLFFLTVWLVSAAGVFLMIQRPNQWHVVLIWCGLVSLILLIMAPLFIKNFAKFWAEQKLELEYEKLK